MLKLKKYTQKEGQRMNIAITDDSLEDRRRIQEILCDYAAASHIPLEVSTFSGAEELLREYRPLRYSAIFLDIYMDGMNGVEAARKIRDVDRDALIVFLTTSEEHMPDAWRVHAFEYILKPVSRDNLFLVMDDILGRITIPEVPRFSFSSQKTECTLIYDDLVMVGTDAHNYLEVTGRSGEKLVTRMTFAEASALLLKDKRFLLLRRGVLVNMAFIREFDDHVCNLTTGASVPISSRNRKKLEQIWDNYLMDSMRADILKGHRDARGND